MLSVSCGSRVTGVFSFWKKKTSTPPLHTVMILQRSGRIDWPSSHGQGRTTKSSNRGRLMPAQLFASLSIQLLYLHRFKIRIHVHCESWHAVLCVPTWSDNFKHSHKQSIFCALLQLPVMVALLWMSFTQMIVPSDDWNERWWWQRAYDSWGISWRHGKWSC